MIAETRGPGRPYGSKNIEAVARVVIPPCCNCGSHNRTKYEGGTPKLKDVEHEGKIFEKVVVRKKRFRCLDCGKANVHEVVELPTNSN